MDGEPDGEWEDPWPEIYLRGRSVPFIIFEGRLTALGRWLEFQTEAVMRFLSAEVTHMNYVSTTEFDELDTGAEAIDYLESRLYWVEAVFPLAAFASIIPLAFGALEQMMTDLIDFAEESQAISFHTFRLESNDPQLNAQMKYLRDVAGWKIDWSKGARRRFGAAQATRNKIAHTFGDSISEDTLKSLNLKSMDSTTGFIWNHETVEDVLRIIVRFAQSIGDAEPD